MLITGFGGRSPRNFRIYCLNFGEYLLNHYKKLSFLMGNFDFPKVWWGGGQYRLVGGWGQLPPLAPMVATALRGIVTINEQAHYWVL